MNSQSYSFFLDSLSRTQLLTPEEEITLARDVQAWLEVEKASKPTLTQKRIIRAGREAYDRFFSANLKLVVHVAQKYKNRTLSLTVEDLIQEGCMGLAQAIRKFDPERGYKFSTYGYWWIRQAIQRSIENSDRLIRLPVIGFQVVCKLRHFRVQFEGEHGRTPTIAECAEHTGVSPDYLRSYLAHADGTISLDNRMGRQGDSTTLLDFVAADQASPTAVVERECDSTQLDDILSVLPEDDQELLSNFYGLAGRPQMSLDELGERLSINKESVRYRKAKIINKLRRKAA